MNMKKISLLVFAKTAFCVLMSTQKSAGGTIDIKKYGLESPSSFRQHPRAVV